MPWFDINTSTNKVKIEPGGTGRVLFTVTNQIGKHVFADAKLEAIEPTSPAWLSVEGDGERDFADKAEEPITVVISPDAKAAPGQYKFLLRMVASSESASEYSHASEPIAFDITAPVAKVEREETTDPPPKPNRWRLVAMGLVILDLLLAIAVIVILLNGPSNPEASLPSTTPQPTTTAPTPVPPTRRPPPLESLRPSIDPPVIR